MNVPFRALELQQRPEFWRKILVKMQPSQWPEGMFASGVELTLSDHVGDLNSGQGGRRGSEWLDPFHLAGQALDANPYKRGQT